MHDDDGLQRPIPPGLFDIAAPINTERANSISINQDDCNLQQVGEGADHAFINSADEPAYNPDCDTTVNFSDGAQFAPYMHDSGMQLLFDDFGSIYHETMPVLDFNGQPAPFNDFLNLEPLVETPSSTQSHANIELDLESITSRPPQCEFAICHTLQPHHRDRLLWTLRSHLDLDCVADDLLSLNSLQHGLHFYFKNVSPEHSIFHPSLIIHAETKQANIAECYGDELSWELVWAMIILGWLCPSYTRLADEKRVYGISARIHEALRSHVLSVSRTRHGVRHTDTRQEVVLTPLPALPLVQLLFLSLIFARYHGRSGKSAGFALNAHGMLIDVCYTAVLATILTNWQIVQKSDTHTFESQQDDSTDMTWLRWIKVESLKRFANHLPA